MSPLESPIAAAIRLAGGPAAVARQLGCTVQAVCFWRDGDRALPVEHGAALEALTGGEVTRRDMWPTTWHHVWPELREAQQPTDTQRAAKGASLQAAAEAHANEVHARRLAELQAMAPLLAKLDCLRPVLAVHGLEVTPDNLSLYREAVCGNPRVRHRVLRLYTGIFPSADTTQRWLTALLAVGFEALSASPGVCPTALMRFGSLLIRIDVPPAYAQQLAAAEVPA